MGIKWGFDGAGMYTHGGMLAAADTVLIEIEKLGILKRLMTTKSSITNEVVSLHLFIYLSIYAEYISLLNFEY